MNSDLFAPDQPQAAETLGRHATLLRGFALPHLDTIKRAVSECTEQLPFRTLYTPSGFAMSAKLSQCGRFGWVSDEAGYRYTERDLLTGAPWPTMPEALHTFAQRAAKAAGFYGFLPDTCLINHYTLGAKMGLHQDRHEHDLKSPIVSLSLGMSAIFQFGGLKRSDPVHKLVLYHGDVVVWGGEDRLRFHGIAGLTGQPHPELGAQRINLTFRRVRRPEDCDMFNSMTAGPAPGIASE